MNTWTKDGAKLFQKKNEKPNLYDFNIGIIYIQIDK